MVVSVGIDVAKDKHDCFIQSSEGEVLADVFTVSNNMDGFNLLLQKIRDCTTPQDKIKVGLEATGHYSCNLLGFLLDNGLATYVLNPLRTNLYRKSLSLRKTKTDRVDARTIASMLLSDAGLKPYTDTAYHNEELMANIQGRRNKDGKLISYSIRVHRGRDASGKQLKPWTATFEVSPTWTEKSARKKAETFAATFEKECKEGVTSDNRQKFAAYCDYVIEQKESRGIKHSTIVRYKELTTRIYPAIGHIKLKDLRADHLNSLYTQLSKPGEGKMHSRAISKIDLAALLKKRSITRSALSEMAGVPLRSIYAAVKGEPVDKEIAQMIASVLQLKMESAFRIEENIRTLSAKTIIEHHRLISTVLEQAVKEGLIPFNVASRATLPKVERKEVNYFQQEQIAAIREALEREPLKWKVLVHLFLITGARRGEVLELKWDKVDFEGKRVYICNSVLYSPDIGIYESTPKTERSKRYISLPVETMQLLRQYRAWQNQERLRLGGYYQDKGFVFSQDTGEPMHPDSVTDYLKKFGKRYDLPHINPHAFRHTMASMLYFNGVDSVSISKRLGHAQVSTTANIYAHVMEEADKKNADILADVFLKKA